MRIIAKNNVKTKTQYSNHVYKYCIIERVVDKFMLIFVEDVKSVYSSDSIVGATPARTLIL